MNIAMSAIFDLNGYLPEKYWLQDLLAVSAVDKYTVYFLHTSEEIFFRNQLAFF